MSGIELKRKLALRTISLSLPVINIVGTEIPETAALEVGCVAYLTKPFAAQLLTAAIGKALDAPSRAELIRSAT